MQKMDEASEQIVLFQWVDVMKRARPELERLFHIPNERKDTWQVLGNDDVYCMLLKIFLKKLLLVIGWQELKVLENIICNRVNTMIV